MKENTKNQPFNNGFVVDDGSIKETIRNKYGEVIGEFMFRPSDLNIVDRYNEAVTDFDSITEPLEHIDINPDGSANAGDDAAFAALTESKKRLFEVVNRVFDADVAGTFFGRVHPFSIVNGRFYCEQILDVLGKYLSHHFDKEVNKMNTRVKKYTHGYTARTGKHKNGDRNKKVVH